ncbi:MAG: DoxX family membrane protein [Myxococcales bacterium FL481]|nr:MAG: DoxX family membrane protein [Myxococcales bacterium FL481]
MAPLVVFIVLLAGFRLAAGRGLRVSTPCRVRFALAGLFLFTGVSHFALPRTLAAMVPAWFPAPELAVYASGAVEIALAVALASRVAIRRPRWVAAVTIALLVGLLPFNIYAAWAGVGPSGEYGLAYLWFRVPVQLLWIGAAWFALRSGAARRVFARLRADSTDAARGVEA